MTIVGFLEARIAEDEAWASDMEAAQDRDASFGRITVRRWLPSFPPGKPYRDPWPLPGEPRLVLREVAAKRAIIAQSREADEYYVHMSEGGGVTSMAVGHVNACAAALKALASVYSDHPDFNEEWRP